MMMMMMMMRTVISVDVLVIFLSIIATDGFLFDKRGIFLVPSVAFRDHSSDTSNWLLYNQGWYYEENPVQALIMEKTIELLVGQDLDHQRIKMFTAEGKKHKEICVDGLDRPMCTLTDDQGRIKNVFTITDEQLKQLRQSSNSEGKLLYQVSIPKRNLRTTGEIYLCDDDDGVTFISDIDDTIKITEVTSTIQTLVNTFTGEFRAVPSMSNVYRRWQQMYNGTFAYLTASPDQLYPFLREFLDREHFPPGSAHMRHFTWLDANFIAFFMSSNYIKKKTEILEMFFDNTRRRRFVLLGDIFQKDPEIYADVYSRYADRIAKIFIRKYHDDHDGLERLQRVFINIPKEKWSTFETGDDLPAHVNI